MFRAGCGIRLHRFLIIAFLSSFHDTLLLLKFSDVTQRMNFDEDNEDDVNDQSNRQSQTQTNDILDKHTTESTMTDKISTDTEGVEQSSKVPSTQMRGPKQPVTHDEKTETVYLVLGDSNTTRVHFKDPDVYNASESGGTLARIDTLPVIYLFPW